MKIPKKTKRKTPEKTWTQAELDALTRKRGYNFRLELTKIHKQAIAMEAYLEQHPGPDVRVWRPIVGGIRNDNDWDSVQDHFGKYIVGRNHPLTIGERFDLGRFKITAIGGKFISGFGLVIAQVSMADAEALAGRKLPRHKPYCYEVICD